MLKGLIPFLILLVACGGGGGGGGGGAANSTVSGKIYYHFVPATSDGLDYENIEDRPIRKIYVEALNSETDEVVDSANTDSLGGYSFDIPSSVKSIYIKLWAEVKSPSIIVEDNTNDDAIYVVESGDYEISGTTEIEDLYARSGWSGTNAAGSYTSTRVSAPFAILDSVVTAVEAISDAKPSLVFPDLKINWSVDNIGTPGDLTIGQIGTSHFSRADNELYILGKADNDTDEHDAHIIVHEWGHYFEFNLGRSDSQGGAHGSGDILDMSVAFGEGWGNALSGIIFSPNITYRDTVGSRQATVSEYSLESTTDTTPGWFSEDSIQELIFDIFDSNNDGTDTISLGLAPIIDVMTTHQKETSARTSIFSFINGMKTNYASSSALLDTLVGGKNIDDVQDDFGTGETNNGGQAYALPVSNLMTVGGATVNMEMKGATILSNHMLNNRYLHFTATATTTRITWQSDDTYLFGIYDGDTLIYDDSEVAPDGNILGPWYDDITTEVGKTYSIRVTTDPDNVFSVVTNVIFLMRAD